MCEWDLKQNFAQYRVNYADTNEPQTLWRKWPQTSDSLDDRSSAKMDKLCRGPYRISSILKWVTEKIKQRGWLKKKNNDCFWMENIFCLESHIHLCSRHTSANPAYVIKTCLTWHAFSGARYWGFVSPKLHVSTYRNQQHCWWFH